MRAVVEAGGQVAFDINYRPQLWEDVAEAASTLQIALAWSTIALPGLDDMGRVFGAGTAKAALRQLESFGVGEAVVKDGAAGVYLSGGELIPAEPVAKVIDTTAAGDAFNGAYLAARMAGKPPEAAAQRRPGGGGPSNSGARRHHSTVRPSFAGILFTRSRAIISQFSRRSPHTD